MEIRYADGRLAVALERSVDELIDALIDWVCRQIEALLAPFTAAPIPA